MKKLIKIDSACAVVAICYVSGIDEETVLRVCRSCGFEAGEGMLDEEWMDAAKQLGIRFRRLVIPEMRLKRFMAEHNEGLYFVGTIDHLFVVDNGILIDPRHPTPPGLGRIVKHAWRVDKR